MVQLKQKKQQTPQVFTNGLTLKRLYRIFLDRAYLGKLQQVSLL
jgi:hypothetical protein